MELPTSAKTHVTSHAATFPFWCLFPKVGVTPPLGECGPRWNSGALHRYHLLVLATINNLLTTFNFLILIYDTNN